MSLMKKLIVSFVVLGLVGAAGVGVLINQYSSELPDVIQLAEYKPLLVTEVYDRDGKKFGEFFRQKRILTPYNQIPKVVVQAFVAAEDDTFFQHDGINFIAIVRAFLANIRSGKKKQGGSTITQQVARAVILNENEKTYSRKIKEILLALKMEDQLKKEDIMYLYLNQIFLGQNAHGVGAAAQIYFRKDLKDITLPEAALLAGLPQAPSRYSPIHNPSAAKERQRYVIQRMKEVGFINSEDAKKYVEEPVKLYVKQNFDEIAPFYLETVRQMLVREIGEEQVLEKGIKIYTGMDLKKQIKAQEEVRSGLRSVDKRQGFRGAVKNLEDAGPVAQFLLETRNQLMDKASPVRILKPDGTFDQRGPLNLTGKDEKGNPLPNIPDYITAGTLTEGVVTKVDDELGLVHVRVAESKGLIDIETMTWARKPDANVRADSALIKKPSDALKSGDVIQVKVVSNQFKSERLAKLLKEREQKSKGKAGAQIELPDLKEFAQFELEQEPLVEGSLLSVDQRTEDVISLVGGYDYERSKYNRAIQAARQTGSAFKALVYLSALDKGYTPATPIIDAPVVYEEVDEGQDGAGGESATKTWRPKNHGNKFTGDVLFRNALIRSLNVPTVKVIEKIGVDWAATYARRLGIFSSLNMDFTLALGSSGITLYEMTRAFGVIGRLGRSLEPIIIRKVLDKDGKEIATNLTLDHRFEVELAPIRDKFEEKRVSYLAEETHSPHDPPIYFEDKDQWIRPQTAYVLTSILQGVIDESGGTGGAARSLGRPAAAKTGSTSDYYDAWFMGYTPDIVTGVWVGFDQEKSLGRGEVGGKAALPIWLEYMKAAHEGLPVSRFPVPEGIVFANIDSETGSTHTAGSKSVVRQAFIEGTEPSEAEHKITAEDEKNFLKEDMSE